MPQFDFDTITDAVLHIRYTAREGGDILKAAAVGNLQTLINKAETVGSTCLFSVRHDFPSQWAKFQRATISGATLPAKLLSIGKVELQLPARSLAVFQHIQPRR